MRRLLGLKPKKHEQKENPRDSHHAPPRPSDPTPPLAEARLNAGETVVGLGLSVPRCVSPLDGLEQDERKGRRVVFDEPTGSSPPLPPVPVSVTRRPSQAARDRESGLAASVGLGLGADLALMRTTSPSSLAPSGGSAFSHSMGSPYLNGTGTQSSLARLSERDPTQIYAPVTWRELVDNQELVDNVSARERTRQEVMWEVVASEERYVLELRSLEKFYVQPLLHPLLLTTPKSLSPMSPPSPVFRSPTPSHRPELPIAARFLRAVNGDSETSLVSRWDSREPESNDGLGTSESSHSTHISRSHKSLPVLPRDAKVSPTFSTSTLLAPHRSGRLSSLPFRHRHPLRPASAGTKLHKSSQSVPSELLAPPTLPPALKSALEVILDMLRGHEDLSVKLKEQWHREFPLVRGLGEVWNSQPWFLEVYARYILSLEQALATLDSLLPSTHSPNQPFSSRTKAKSQSEKDEQRLAHVIMALEERAADEGESGLAICLSKPLMRLGKLPLLMQNLLYQSDAAASFEWEKTRAMALEIDALICSIEDEKLQDEEREKVRDLLARVEGINDKALMAPRSSRIVLEETSVWQPTTSIPSSLPPNASPNPRRATSDAASRKTRPTFSTSPTLDQKNMSINRRMSAFVTRDDKSPTMGSKKDIWMIVFSDVTIRCQRTGTTDIPGAFSRDKAKQKQEKVGRVKKRGRTRNLYKFLRVERWEMKDLTGRAVGLDGVEGVEQGFRGARETSSEDEEEDDNADAESRMSFSYEQDEPRPNALPRNFKDPRPTTPKTTNRSLSSMSTRAALTKEPAARSKFGSRLRIGPDDSPPLPSARSPTPSQGTTRRRFDTPTVASLARTVPTVPKPPPTIKTPLPRADSSMRIFEEYWDGDSARIPFPST